MTGPVLRSWLFVPGDDGRKLGKADGAGADALILDLEDSVAPGRKAEARERVAGFLRERPRSGRRAELWVRINPLDTLLDPGLALADLAAVVSAEPDGIVLPKPGGAADVERLSHYLDALEAQAGLRPGAVGVLPVATETAAAPFALSTYAERRPARLRGLTWGAEDLSAALGAGVNLEAGGGWAFTYRMARSLTLMAAHAAGVQAVETLAVDFRDEDGLRASCRVARGEGFTGRLAIHPAQVPVINEAFTPSQVELDHARRVLAAFAAAPGAGVVALDGRMLDGPHLKQAQGLLSRSAALEERS